MCDDLERLHGFQDTDLISIHSRLTKRKHISIQSYVFCQKTRFHDYMVVVIMTNVKDRKCYPLLSINKERALQPSVHDAKHITMYVVMKKHFFRFNH